MPIILEDNEISGNIIGVSVPKGAHVEARRNKILNNEIAIQERDDEPVTVLKGDGFRLELPGRWTAEDISELMQAIQSPQARRENAEKTKIGAYLRKKLVDPVAFAAEIAAIASAFGFGS